jgi:hypothetical protein
MIQKEKNKDAIRQFIKGMLSMALFVVFFLSSNWLNITNMQRTELFSLGQATSKLLYPNTD